MRATLQEELDTLQSTLLEEGELVLRALRGSMEALENRDPELADEVIAFDDEVDRQYIGIEENIASLLARQAPAAGDLRLVLAMLHTNLHLERMADYCVTIAKLTKLVYGITPDQRLIVAFQEMGARDEEMIRAALDSFANRDVAVAESLVELDELVDRGNRRVMGHVLALGSNPDASRVGPADDRGLTVPGADRRPRCRHRGTDRVPRHGRVPRVHRRFARRSHRHVGAICVANARLTPDANSG